MKNYYLKIPIAGIAEIDVKANNEEEAKRKAFKILTNDDITEWDAYEILCEGNIMRFPQNEIEIEEN